MNISHLTQLRTCVGLLFTGVLMINCGCPEGDRREFLTEAHFGFQLLDAKTGKDLFADQIYSFDSVRLLNNTIALRKSKSGYDDYIFSFDTIYNDRQNQIGRRVEIVSYLYLNRFDTDTIRLSFLPTQGKCNQYFNDYQVFYKERLITTEQNVTSVFTKIRKI